MEYEIDFMPVGESSKSGDAIALRFGDLSSSSTQYVVVVDGGTKESGEKLVEHIKTYYGTTTVNLVISTHPDGDHSSGLTVILENLTVEKLWMHKPWEHSADVRDLFKNGRITISGLKDTLKKSMDNVNDLSQLARSKRVEIEEPFAGLTACNGIIEVLGPSKEYYQSLLPHFRSTPTAREVKSSVFDSVADALQKAISWLVENWHKENLLEPDENATSPENNSSVITLFKFGGKFLLLTGDAGVPALSEAVNYAEAKKYALQSVSFVQVPHHGSKRNVGPAVLDRILGPRRSLENDYVRTAFISVAKDAEPKHPSKKVVNAFTRRGCRVNVTQGTTIRHASPGAPPRSNYQPITPIPIFPQVEND